MAWGFFLPVVTARADDQRFPMPCGPSADQVDRHLSAAHTQVHDNACPEVPDLRQPAYP